MIPPASAARAVDSSRRKGPNNDLVIEWLRRHSGLDQFGLQCDRHPSMSRMTSRQQLDALLEDTGLRRTHQWLMVLCRRLGIPRQGKLTRRPESEASSERRREQGRERWRRRYQRLSRDPDRFEQYRRRARTRKE